MQSSRRTFGRQIAARLGLVACALAVLGGCTSIRAHRGYVVDKALIESVTPGVDNRQSVERALGRPTFVSQFGEKTYYYVASDTRRSAFSRQRTVGQTVLAVHFDEADNVSSVQRSGMEQVARIDPDGDKTPTLGRERSFVEDLFGNIGAVGVPGGGAAGGPGPNGS